MGSSAPAPASPRDRERDQHQLPLAKREPGASRSRDVPTPRLVDRRHAALSAGRAPCGSASFGNGLSATTSSTRVANGSVAVGPPRPGSTSPWGRGSERLAGGVTPLTVGRGAGDRAQERRLPRPARTGPADPLTGGGRGRGRAPPACRDRRWSRHAGRPCSARIRRSRYRKNGAITAADVDRDSLSSRATRSA